VVYSSVARRSFVSKKRFDLMPPNGKAPSMLHLAGEIEEPQIPVKAFVFPAENILSILKSLDGQTTFRQKGLPSDARVVGCALANGLPNTIVIFVTSSTWPIVPISNLPEPAALHIEVIAEKTEEERTVDGPWDPANWPRAERSENAPE
jgi:hypothetical protein